MQTTHTPTILTPLHLLKKRPLLPNPLHRISNKHSKVNDPNSTHDYCLPMILLARKELLLTLPLHSYLDSKYEVVV